MTMAAESFVKNQEAAAAAAKEGEDPKRSEASSGALCSNLHNSIEMRHMKNLAMWSDPFRTLAFLTFVSTFYFSKVLMPIHLALINSALILISLSLIMKILSTQLPQAASYHSFFETCLNPARVEQLFQASVHPARRLIIANLHECLQAKHPAKTIIGLIVAYVALRVFSSDLLIVWTPLLLIVIFFGVYPLLIKLDFPLDAALASGVKQLCGMATKAKLFVKKNFQSLNMSGGASSQAKDTSQKLD